MKETVYKCNCCHIELSNDKRFLWELTGELVLRGPSRGAAAGGPVATAIIEMHFCDICSSGLKIEEQLSKVK